jgi:hypothetical protein
VPSNDADFYLTHWSAFFLDHFSLSQVSEYCRLVKNQTESNADIRFIVTSYHFCLERKINRTKERSTMSVCEFYKSFFFLFLLAYFTIEEGEKGRLRFHNNYNYLAFEGKQASVMSLV